jgi:hypothetical protein
MKLINTKVHGVIDYLMGILLIASPWLFNFADGSAAQGVPVILGLLVLIMSIFTNYEYGVVRMISMRTHLAIDLITGVLLAVSPWIFGFSDYVYLPHLILGLFEVGAAVFTERVPHFVARTSSEKVHHPH